MRILRLVATVTAALVVGIATLALGVVVGLAAVPTVSLFGPPQANAVQTSSGTFRVDPATGTDVTIVQGLTSSPCDVPGTEAAPVDGFNGVVTGPGGAG